MAKKAIESAMAWFEWEREQMLADYKAREEKALQVLKEYPDDKGKLWNEKTFSELSENDEVKWDGDTIGRLCPDPFSDPERVAMLREIFAVVANTIRSAYGEKAYRLFLDWLDRTTVAELAEERNESFLSLLRQIKAIVAKCRDLFGTDPYIFPFSEFAGGKTAYWQRWSRKYKSCAEPNLPEKSIWLTSDEKEMSLDDLHKHLQARGIETSRSGAWRAQKRGWLMPAGYQHESHTPGKKVVLSEAERQLPPAIVAKKFGVSLFTARAGKVRGYFFKNSTNEFLVAMEPDAREIARWSLPDKLEKTPNGRAVGELTVVEIEQIFEIAQSGAQLAKKRGYVYARSWDPKKKTRFAQIYNLAQPI